MADIGDPPVQLGEILESAPADETPRERERRFGRLGRVLAIFAVVVGFAFIVVWTQRESIANNVIGRELKSRGIPATYRVERIGARRQVLADIVVGNRGRPDLTVKRAEVELVYRLGFPGIGRITLVEPRLYGSYRGGKLSFGTLDPLLFTGRKRAFELPRLDMRIADGRALVETDYGPVGIKTEGQGRLNDGFTGILAIAAPQLAGFGCTAQRASYYGTIRIAAGRPRLIGPLRWRAVDCPARSVSLETAAMQLDTTLDKDLAGAEGDAKLVAGRLALAGYRAAATDLGSRFTYRNGNLTMRLDGGFAGVATPQAGFGRLATTGTLRARDDFARIEYQGQIEGKGVRLGTGLERTLAGAQAGASGTLLAPLIAQLRSALVREARGGELVAEVDLRKAGPATTLVIPQASLSGGSGATLAALSRFSLRTGGAAAPRLAGNFTTGGPGLPRIAGRMERAGNGRAVFRVAMAEYRAGSSALALPRLALVQGRDGSLGFVGEARASGPLPGGMTQNLVLPLDGSLGANGSLALFRRCTPISFDRLSFASLTLERRGLTLCPQRGRPIVRYAGGSLSIAAGAPSLDLVGRLGQTPIRLASGPAGFAYPGNLSATRVDVALGPAATASRFRISNLSARVGKDIAGSFEGADVRLAATPLDITDATGRWRYAANRLTISETALRVSDRADLPRFAPLVARDAGLTLFANRIDAAASLRQPATDREVAQVTIRHDLRTARGYADLAVTALVFDDRLQPADVSRLALGSIANARGTIAGTGRIDWTPAGVTSRGRFSTDRLDFAAAFGPVQGLSGTVEFTDLLGRVTAPDQEVRVAALNPGIEVTEGSVRFELNGTRLLLKSASWPFLGGKLTLAPTTLNLGVSEPRKYTLLIEGLDAARFVERMGLGNLQATGIFDGELPLVFSAASPSEQVAAAVGTVLGIGTEQGAQAAQSTPGSGRIVNGLLQSRPPGGNVSYVGELTYRDLSPMANFAFQTLRSLDYKSMDIALNGSLEGEIVTNVRFGGVKQGAGAKRNFLTRAVADLPIEMRVNVRAPFYQLITSFKALYDPAFVKDPRGLEVGLLDAQGRPIVRPVATPPPAQPNIQPSESERVP
ncbi:MAG: YdbH domain-containing protein [Novosphingobium sp.]|nr:YdbH domain-containing protein [Novosphingobium sp.]